MSSLRSSVQQLAASFAEDLLKAIRESSLEEILGQTAAPARATRTAQKSAPRASAPAAKPGRRSASGDVDKTVERIVALLKKKTKGLRSEDLRAQLKLEKPELQRAASKALGDNLITKTGEKRATTYFAK